MRRATCFLLTLLATSAIPLHAQHTHSKLVERTSFGVSTIFLAAAVRDNMRQEPPSAHPRASGRIAETVLCTMTLPFDGTLSATRDTIQRPPVS
jgi:hypothetical protein